MELFRKKIGPVFLKETSDALGYIEKLHNLQNMADETLQKEIEKQMKLAKYGADGENKVAYELKTSGIDMYILHDIYLQINDLSAQIDYIVITRKHIYVLECKNLIGNIEIDSSGNFIRTYELFGRKVREGIYSPITQNQRHLQVLKEIRKGSKSNFLTQMIFEKNFDDIYKSVVVLANPKTCLNARYAKKEVKQQVIRADQLISYIKEMDSRIKDSRMTEKQMCELAKFFLEKSVPGSSDYARKYEELVMGVEAKEQNQKEKKLENPVEKNLDEVEKKREELVKKLKAFRTEQSRKEGIKAYYIFSDEQMLALIEKNPYTKEEMLEVSGFGNVKVEKYGEELLEILHHICLQSK